MSRIEVQYGLVKTQVEKAEKLFLDPEMLPEALQNIFAIFENCANLIKDIKNHFPKSQHTKINAILREMYLRKVLKQDYSAYHDQLNDYRVIAFFGEYSRENKPMPPKASLKIYLTKAKELYLEIRPIAEEYLKEEREKKDAKDKKMIS